VTDLGRVPGLRRAVHTKRHFEHLLVEVDARVRELSPATLDAIAADTAVLLQAMQQVVTVLSEQQRRLDDLTTALDRLAASNEAAGPNESEAVRALETALVTAIDVADRRMADRLDILRERLEATVRPDPDAAAAHVALLRLVGRPVTANGHPLSTGTTHPDDAELHLCAYLAPFLDSRYVMDVGAHHGRYTRALLDQGLTVAAVEPNPELAAILERAVGGRDGAVVRKVAAAAGEGTARLRLARDRTPDGLFGDTTLLSTLLERPGVEDLDFEDGPEITTTTVEAIRRDLDWPAKIGLLKIDVEGGELSVIEGLGATRAEVVMVEFWGSDYVLAVPGREAGAGPLIRRMSALGYRHWISIIHEGNDISFAINAHDVAAGSWGNLLFFEGRDAFLAATRWCSASMPERVEAQRITAD
jgi:FkbM family methyltransferase